MNEDNLSLVLFIGSIIGLMVILPYLGVQWGRRAERTALDEALRGAIEESYYEGKLDGARMCQGVTNG